MNRFKFIISFLLFLTFQIEGVEETKQPQVHTMDLIFPIDAQLRAFREKNLSRAYQETSSQDFKKMTDFETFKNFVERYPILFDHQQVSVKSQSQQGDRANLVIALNPSNENVSVQYTLVKEGASWKIWSMDVLAGYSASIYELIKNPDSLKPPVENFLQAIKENNLSAAYYTYTSRDFQSTTPFDGFRKLVERFPALTSYENLSLKNPVIEKGTGKLEAHLQTSNVIMSLDFTLGIEENKWKIFGVDILKQTPVVSPNMPQERPSESAHAEPEEEVSPNGPLVLSKVDLGNKIDAKGAVIDPQSTLPSSHEKIYVNLFVRNGTSGSKIDVRLKHVESQQMLPTIATTLQQNGNSVVSFAFSPPATGWPVGTYQIIAESSTGVKRTFSFIVE